VLKIKNPLFVQKSLGAMKNVEIDQVKKKENKEAIIATRYIRIPI
jgi:hypothetical protein